MPIRWTAENEQKILLIGIKIGVFTMNPSVAQQIQENWPTNGNDEAPTARAITERISAIKKKAADLSNGAGATNGTPRKPRGRAAATSTPRRSNVRTSRPVTPASKKRRRGRQDSDADDNAEPDISFDEKENAKVTDRDHATTTEDDDEEEEAPTPSRSRNARNSKRSKAQAFKATLSSGAKLVDLVSPDDKTVRHAAGLDEDRESPSPTPRQIGRRGNGLSTNGNGHGNGFITGAGMGAAAPKGFYDDDEDMQSMLRVASQTSNGYGAGYAVEMKQELDEDYLMTGGGNEI